MTHADAIRLLHTLQDMLDNARVLADESDCPIKLALMEDFALRFSDACGHAARALAGLTEEEE
jgi:hypothetical protein